MAKPKIKYQMGRIQLRSSIPRGNDLDFVYFWLQRFSAAKAINFQIFCGLIECERCQRTLIQIFETTATNEFCD